MVCLVLPVPLFHSLSPMNPDAVTLQYPHCIKEEKLHWWKNLFFFKCWIRSGLTEATQAYKSAPQACTGGTKHDGCTTLSTSLLTLILSSVWNRTHLRTRPFSFNIQSHLHSPYQIKACFFSQFASMISGFLKAKSCLVPIPWVLFALSMWVSSNTLLLLFSCFLCLMLVNI